MVVSEESAAHWVARGRKLDLGGHVWWLCRPFRGKPRPEEWLALVDRLGELRERHGIDLAVIDPLGPFLSAENNSRSMLDALLPLRELTRRGMAGLLLHHPGKGERALGQAARVPGVTPAAVSILLVYLKKRALGSPPKVA